jgi:PTH1 family peptidyl-tRNA hydrolase
VPEDRDPADFVLGRFSAEERKQVDKVVPRAADAVMAWGTQGLASAMNQFNG